MKTLKISPEDMKARMQQVAEYFAEAAKAQANSPTKASKWLHKGNTHIACETGLNYTRYQLHLGKNRYSNQGHIAVKSSLKQNTPALQAMIYFITEIENTKIEPEKLFELGCKVLACLYLAAEFSKENFFMVGKVRVTRMCPFPSRPTTAFCFEHYTTGHSSILYFQFDLEDIDNETAVRLAAFILGIK